MSGFIVAVTDDRYGSYAEEQAVLEGIGAELRVLNLTSETEARRELAYADAILVNLFPMTSSLIESLPRCRIISRYGVGYDNVDVPAATRKGIWVARVPDYCFEDVADHAMALLLGCVRKTAWKDRKIREGEWNLHRAQPIFRIAGKTLGLVGYGATARCLHHKVCGFGFARVLAYDPYQKPSVIQTVGGVPADLPTLLAESDFVSLHVPLTDETRHMIGERELAMMKRSAILINTARGALLDEGAVASALARGRIGGAGLDVFETEPLPASSPLLRLDNVILSDHESWYSEESIVELKTKAARNVAAVLAGGAPPYPVNSV